MPGTQCLQHKFSAIILFGVELPVFNCYGRLQRMLCELHVRPSKALMLARLTSSFAKPRVQVAKHLLLCQAISSSQGTSP